MNRTGVYVVLLALSPLIVCAQAEHNRSSPVKGYENTELGFRYRPPQEMLDKTADSIATLDDQAKHLHIKNDLKLLLSMSSGPNDKAVGWHSLTIMSYPRNAYSGLDDASAEAKMNNWAGADSDTLPSSGEKVLISGQTFTMSLFIVKVDGVKKSSVVWTTTRRGKLLSFAFAANSPEQLKALGESMKTVQFF